MKNISIIGTGYVGLVTGVCLAELGNKVLCVDNEIQKIDLLKKGISPIYEPNLEPLLKHNIDLQRLFFSTSIQEGTNHGEIIFIAVDTPSKDDGAVDLSSVKNVSIQIAQAMKEYKIIVEKSTVPVHTGEWIKHTIESNNTLKIEFDVVSNPEFLKEGMAIVDFMHPDRIVIGCESKRAEEIMTKLYIPLGVPIIITDIKSAEIIKHASNSFLALKISYINAIANICEKAKADITKVAEGIGFDKRINKEFLNAGIGYGGSCLPKDISAFVKIAEELGYKFDLLKEVQKINTEQRKIFIKKIKEVLGSIKGKTIGILGLSFKPNTDDIREAPSIEIIKILLKEEAKIKVYDPQAMKNIAKIFPKIIYCSNSYEVAEQSDCLLILTDWDEFKKLSLKIIKEKLKYPYIIDGRNIYNPEALETLGFVYKSMGR